MKNLLLVALTTFFFIGCSAGNVAQEVEDDYSNGNIDPPILAAAGPPTGATPGVFLGEMFGGSGRTSLGLPNYAYFQGILQSNRHIILLGQVRLIGGTMVSYDEGTVDLYRGAMVTSSPDYFLSHFGQLQGGTNTGTLRVVEWREVTGN